MLLSVHLPWIFAQKFGWPVHPGSLGSQSFPKKLSGLPSLRGGMYSATEVRDTVMVFQPSTLAKKVSTSSETWT